MKCELCSKQNKGDARLCGDCGDMILRLLDIESRSQALAGEALDGDISGLLKQPIAKAAGGLDKNR